MFARLNADGRFDLMNQSAPDCNRSSCYSSRGSLPPFRETKPDIINPRSFEKSRGKLKMNLELFFLRRLFHRILSLIPFLQLFTFLFPRMEALSIYRSIERVNRRNANSLQSTQRINLATLVNEATTSHIGDRSKSLSAYRSSSVIQCRAGIPTERGWLASIRPLINQDNRGVSLG